MSELGPALLSRVSAQPSLHYISGWGIWLILDVKWTFNQNASAQTLLEAYWIKTFGQRAQKSVFLVPASTFHLPSTVCPSYSLALGIWRHGSLSNSFERRTPSPSCFEQNTHKVVYSLPAAAHTDIPRIGKQAGHPRGNFESSLRGVAITVMFVRFGFSCAKLKVCKEASNAASVHRVSICSNAWHKMTRWARPMCCCVSVKPCLPI